MSISLAQTFYIDKTLTRDSETVVIDSINLYFKAIPQKTNNRSGINSPGVSVFISPVDGNDVPDSDSIFETGIARAEYNQIVASSDASIVTIFSFIRPLVLTTNQSYAILISYDGDEEFELWTCREGDVLVTTNTITAGASAKNVGKYYEYHVDDPNHWKPLSNVDLKFTINVCVFNANAQANTTTDTYLIPSDPMEYVVYDRYHTKSLNPLSLQIGEMVFQETPVIFGTINVSNSSTIITSSNNINFSTILSEAQVSDIVLSSNPTVDNPVYIVLRNGSTSAANVDVVSVKSVISNTQIQLDRLPVFTNNTATFSISACGVLEYNDIFYYTGRWFNYNTSSFSRYTANKVDMVRLNQSNANSSVRIANSIVESIIITSGGTGYSNSDVLTVYPVLNSNTANSQNIAYIPEYANSTANVITNSAGTITGLSMTSAGWGLTSTIAFGITTSNGSGANVSITTGCTLRGAESGSTLGGCFSTAIPINRTYPNIRVAMNQHHDITYTQHFPYYVYPQFEHLINQSNVAYSTVVHQFQNSPVIDTLHNDGREIVITSYSQVQRMASNVAVTFANGTTFTTQVHVPSLVELDVSSNNVFTMPVLSHGTSYNYSYIINDDLTGEIKGHGNAMARHISEKVTFANDRNAEDILVYCDVYKPIGTDISVFTRLHNVSDQEAFENKDWTQLHVTSNNYSYVSSLTNESDIVQLTFGLPTSPASVNNIAGYVSCTISSSNVSGLGTAFNTDLQVNDVVKIYSELFPTNYMISVVRNITNSSFITIDDSVANNGLVGTNCKLDLIGRPANGANSEIGQPFQAFSYAPHSYIARYYDSAMSKKDTYNTFQVKVVLTSNSASIVPKVWNTRAVGVSA